MATLATTTNLKNAAYIAGAAYMAKKTFDSLTDETWSGTSSRLKLILTSLYIGMNSDNIKIPRNFTHVKDIFSKIPTMFQYLFFKSLLRNLIKDGSWLYVNTKSMIANNVQIERETDELNGKIQSFVTLLDLSYNFMTISKQPKYQAEVVKYSSQIISLLGPDAVKAKAAFLLEVSSVEKMLQNPRLIFEAINGR